jgi:hypothetical protein
MEGTTGGLPLYPETGFVTQVHYRGGRCDKQCRYPVADWERRRFWRTLEQQACSRDAVTQRGSAMFAEKSREAVQELPEGVREPGNVT